MATEASTKRGTERRKLLESLMEEIRRKEERLGDPALLLKIIRVLSEYLEQSMHHWVRPDFTEETLFLYEVLDQIRTFSRSQAEYEFLFAALLEEVAQCVASHRRSELQRREDSSD